MCFAIETAPDGVVNGTRNVPDEPESQFPQALKVLQFVPESDFGSRSVEPERLELLRFGQRSA